VKHASGSIVSHDGPEPARAYSRPRARSDAPGIRRGAARSGITYALYVQNSYIPGRTVYNKKFPASQVPRLPVGIYWGVTTKLAQPQKSRRNRIKLTRCHLMTVDKLR
jgi:hypothetical protein